MGRSIVPHFLACSLYQPQRLKAAFVGAGHILTMVDQTNRASLTSFLPGTQQVLDGSHHLLVFSVGQQLHQDVLVLGAQQSTVPV